jgi:hypothetical protein
VCTERSEQWQRVREDREAVIAALTRAECDGILPAVAGFMDRFASFCIEIGLREWLGEFEIMRLERERGLQKRSTAPGSARCTAISGRCWRGAWRGDSTDADGDSA